MTRRTQREVGTPLLAVCFLLAQLAGSLHYVTQPHAACEAHQTLSHADHHCSPGPGVEAPGDHASCTVSLTASLCAPPVAHVPPVVSALLVPAQADTMAAQAASQGRRWLLAPKTSPPA